MRKLSIGLLLFQLAVAPAHAGIVDLVNGVSVGRQLPVNEIKIDSPRIHIVRYDAQRFNFTDLIEKFASKDTVPKPKKAEPDTRPPTPKLPRLSRRASWMKSRRAFGPSGSSPLWQRSSW